jgi:hypothetical protein
MDERYLTSFEDQTTALGYTSGDTTLVSPQVSLVGADEVVYTKKIPNDSKVRFAKDEETGKLYFVVDVEETDPTEGYVDLGLSVMWASCDVGATSPEGEGAKYVWGEDSWGTIPLEFDPVYINSDMEWKEVLRPRTPSPAQVQELLDNTTAVEEVLNGVEGIRYTASNGNSIFVSNDERWTNAMNMNANPWVLAQAVHWTPNSGLIDNGTGDSIYKSTELSFRGVCSNLPQGGAEFLKRETTVTIQPEQLYCFPKTWTATQILAATSQPVSVYISNIADFEVGDENVLMSRPAFLENSQRAVYLSGLELANLAEQATEDYLYVRFSCASSTEVLINTWEASECADESILLIPNTPQFIKAKSVFTNYRVRYADFSGYPLTIKWNSSDRMMIYIAETCDFSLTTNNEALLLNPAPSIAKGGELILDAAEIDAWASRIAEDGYFYVRLDAKRSGEITLVTEKPADVDPVSTTSLTSTDCGCTN